MREILMCLIVLLYSDFLPVFLSRLAVQTSASCLSWVDFMGGPWVRNVTLGKKDAALSFTFQFNLISEYCICLGLLYWFSAGHGICSPWHQLCFHPVFPVFLMSELPVVLLFRIKIPAHDILEN